MKQPTVAETLLCLDSVLKYLAAERTAAAVADNIARAEDFDRQWHIFDEDRQNLIACARDLDLIAYEIARGREQQRAVRILGT